MPPVKAAALANEVNEAAILFPAPIAANEPAALSKTAIESSILSTADAKSVIVSAVAAETDEKMTVSAPPPVVITSTPAPPVSELVIK